MVEIEWLAKAREQYQSFEKQDVSVETNFSRVYQTTVDILERKVIPGNRRPNILLVGIGCKGGFSNPMICTYSPFVVASLMESKKVQFRMTLVDIVSLIIEDVKTRKNLYVAESSFEDSDMKEDWVRFSTATGQKEKIVHEREEGLIFDEYTEQHEAIFTPDYHLKRGIRAIEVPGSFREKIATGEISLKNDDIAVVDLSSHGPFDYVESTNVLYHLSTEGQMLALANIAFSLNKNGLVLINDMGGYDNKTPLFKRLKGWLDEEKLKQLGLIIDDYEYKVNYLEDGRYTDEVPTIRALLKKE